MLAAIRNSLNSWIVKALFLVLIASFAVWGIGDFVRGTPAERSVARVGDAKVSLAEATEAYQRELAQLRRSLGGQFEPTGPVRQAIAEAALGRLLALRALDLEVERIGVVVPDEALREAVFSAEVFRGADGRFSRLQFQAFLRNQGLTERRFLELLRGDLARGQLVGSVRVGALGPRGARGRTVRISQRKTGGRPRRASLRRLPRPRRADGGAAQAALRQQSRPVHRSRIPRGDVHPSRRRRPRARDRDPGAPASHCVRREERRVLFARTARHRPGRGSGRDAGPGDRRGLGGRGVDGEHCRRGRGRRWHRRRARPALARGASPAGPGRGRFRPPSGRRQRADPQPVRLARGAGRGDRAGDGTELR
ncbi:MAG: SurA N-terminal domain-containing protein [Acetobacteraceae bacterium]|nr:SurA N-terminal domain-containing protein [Acetobacteraceae bacterium]